ncbi:hypothetical protein CU102_03180 [Phyllobacterium brassicacearum]|uniref:Uncharacterized protein n=1 Tax=Phyllobacterium brassicacearum TaxID=314235 RepID=A0A2P7BUG8_9HYPH|nr:hypothetical protein CU102_03180 [Phyllobacterium brassicacearum]TDQ34015.1 hypothetical protein DEV91_104218 [Phyllobacterium brassicacearum]
MMELLVSANNAIIRTSFLARLLLRGLIVGVATLISYQFFPKDSYYLFVILLCVAAIVGGLWWRNDETGLWQGGKNKQ